MKKTTVNTVEDLENKQTVANQNAKINDSARRISDADDDEDETDDTDEDYKELLEQYGLEYLQEHTIGEYALYNMGEFNEIVNINGIQPEDVFDMGRMAYSYITGDPNNNKNEWMWSDDYFFFDGYGHLCSIADSQLQDYFSYHIEEEDFMEWCEEMGYADSEIEE